MKKWLQGLILWVLKVMCKQKFFNLGSLNLTPSWSVIGPFCKTLNLKLQQGYEGDCEWMKERPL